ncbi:MAG TPA: 30S ribosome-binding factor RbfA [Acidimicrobiales bacterium]|nr:30S ribosome-binding factor RbfA [Acidimicrobiales bacterium]
MAKRTRSHQTARDYPRTARLNRLFQEILAEELERSDDDRLEMVTITAVTVDAALGRAVVLYDNPGGAEDDDDVLEALAEARGRLQSAIARQARVKRTPELVFRPDDVLRDAARLEAVLRDLREDP